MAASSTPLAPPRLAQVISAAYARLSSRTNLNDDDDLDNIDPDEVRRDVQRPVKCAPGTKK